MQGITSVLWGIRQYCGEIASVLWGKTAVHVRDNSTVGIPLVLWRLFSTVGDNSSICGGCSVQWGIPWRIYLAHWGIPPVHAKG